MKIGLFTRCLCDGGTERVAAGLGALWNGIGHDVVLLTRYSPSENDFNYVCSKRIVANSNEWDVNELVEIGRAENFDVVVANGGWNSPDFIKIVRVFNELRVKVVTILHHSFNNWALGKCNEGDFEKDEVLPLIDCLVCVDRLQAFWWSRRHSKVVWIENPVPVFGVGSLIDDSKNDRCNINQEKKEIVWIGRPRDRGKRVELAIEVFKKIATKDQDMTLTVVGDIENAHAKSLLEMLDSKTRRRVVFAGFVRDTEHYLKNAIVNLVTTLWEVTVPQVILEAQAAGVPTVALELPVLRGVCGVKSVGSIEEMAAVVLEMKTNGLRKDRKPFVDISARNNKVQNMWAELFKAIHSSGLENFVNDNSVEWRTLESAELLLDEIQRGETFFMHQEYPRLKQLDLFKVKANRILHFLGIKI